MEEGDQTTDNNSKQNFQVPKIPVSDEEELVADAGESARQDLISSMQEIKGGDTSAILKDLPKRQETRGKRQEAKTLQDKLPEIPKVAPTLKPEPAQTQPTKPEPTFEIPEKPKLPEVAAVPPPAAQPQKPRESLIPPEIPKKPAPKPPIRPTIPTVRTFKGDIAGTIKHQDTSLASMAIREAQKRRRQVYLENKTSRSRNFLVGASIFFIIAAIGVASFFFFYKKDDSDKIIIPMPNNNLPEEIISVDQVDSIDFTNKSQTAARGAIAEKILNDLLRITFIEKVLLAHSAELTDGSFRHQVILPQELFSMLATVAPDRLRRLLEDDYFFGIHAFSENSGFFIFKTKSYQGVFAEMLRWENNLGNDLYYVLSGKPFPEELLNKKWEDVVVKNIDTRVLRDSEENVMLLYSFFGTRDTLFIGTNKDTFEEVLTRFQTPRSIIK